MMREVKVGDGIIIHLPDVKQRVETKRATRYECECHRILGNDFWFLPTGSCLRKEKVCNHEAV